MGQKPKPSGLWGEWGEEVEQRVGTTLLRTFSGKGSRDG